MAKVTLIRGDGVGPEVIRAAQICLEAAEADIEWEEALAGEAARKEQGSLLPSQTLDSIRRNKVALKGPLTTPVGGGFRSLNVEIRRRLDLYACLRPARFWGSVHSLYKDVDIVIVRENKEDLYAGIEFDIDDEFTGIVKEEIKKRTQQEFSSHTAISLKIISQEEAARIARFAFEYALANRRKKVSCVHKANIIKFSDGLFLKTFYEVAKEYEGKIEANDIIVDNLAMQLVQKPQNLDVLVLPNLYGDIISDLAAGLIGGLGIAPGANLGDGMAVFEPVHGAAPKYAGKNMVNPTATILSAVLMLHYLGQKREAEILEKAVKRVIEEGKVVTYDLRQDRDKNKAAGTQEMAEEIAEKVREIREKD